MKTLFFVLVTALLASAAWGQNGFNTVIPDSPVNLQVSDSYVSASGHWVSLDKHSELSGPSVSEIFCDRKVCHESQANMTVFKDGTFTLYADHVEYTVERWNSKEIVAASIVGICKIRSVLKFDLAQKKVYSMQTLSEPINDMPKLSKDICSAAGMNLELKDIAAWKR